MGLNMMTAVREDAVDIRRNDEKIIALAGNPNVGKSTLFNSLTGMNQHTGNWSGKTVGVAQGLYKGKNSSYILVDIPGTYSLLAHSAEEECARNFICFGDSDAVTVVCDATCLERNMNLVLQIMEISENILVCVNLMDEAKRKGIFPDLELLSQRLGVTVVGTSASTKSTLKVFKSELEKVAEKRKNGERFKVEYPFSIETAVSLLEPVLKNTFGERIDCRWLALRLLSDDKALLAGAEEYLGVSITQNDEVKEVLKTVFSGLEKSGIHKEEIGDIIASAVVRYAHKICDGAIKTETPNTDSIDRKIDRIITGKFTAYPIMLILLAVVFWITVEGANYPSAWLSTLFLKLEGTINNCFIYFNAPEWLRAVTVDGAYRVLTWVVAVMLPPMAIFFPFFTILEDLGYLPRIAFNLDKPFKKCSACGKQALTTCMGFGCNAAGVTGCRIIDSERERLLAVLTNSFVPCNGRFPALIAVISMFCLGGLSGVVSSLAAALSLAAVIVFAVAMTLLATKLLSKTFLKGVPSAFTLELPPYRRPKIMEVIVRSVFDRTLFVLARAVVVAIPAGVVIWLMANITVGNMSLLSYCAEFLEPLGRLMGLDGVILIAFILGLPANEIVIPIIIMAYTSAGSLTEMGGLDSVKELFVANGWNITTAICVIIFLVLHWPCSTTLITIKKETGSIKWTALAFLLPTLIGIVLCMVVSSVSKLIF